jgi:succinate dehydrogenase/fumarate reductase cytochrome b subunit
MGKTFRQYKKPLALIGVASVYLLIAASTAYAQNPSAFLQAPVGSVDTNTKVENVPQLVINLLFGVAIFLTVAYMLYGGIRWITSRGDKAKVEEARKQITAALIGVVVVAGTFFILQVVFNVLGADNPLKKGFTLPTLKNARSSPGP